MAQKQDPRLRNIKIKMGVVKRYGKEKVMYEQEIVDGEVKIEKMKNDASKDEYDVRKMIEVVDESRTMVPDCQRRLKVSYDELEQILLKESDLSESTEYKTAQQIMIDAKPQLPQ